MSDAGLTLYVDAFFISPYALSSFVALEEKGLPYDLVTVPLHERAQLRPEYGARTNRVPSLRHDTLWIAESSAIAEYLEDAFPGRPRLLPADLAERAIAREIMSWVRSDLSSIRQERGTHTVFYDEPIAALSETAQRDVARLVRAASAWVHGDTLFEEWCLADADLAMMLMRLRKRDAHLLPEGLVRYVDASWSRPSVQKWATHARPTYRPY